MNELEVVVRAKKKILESLIQKVWVGERSDVQTLLKRKQQELQESKENKTNLDRSSSMTSLPFPSLPPLEINSYGTCGHFKSQLLLDGKECPAAGNESPTSVCCDMSHNGNPVSLVTYDNSTSFSTTYDDFTDSSALSYNSVCLPDYEFDNDQFCFLHRDESFISLQNRSHRYVCGILFDV